MKLVIGGTTGFLGAEVLSQALRHPAITSVVALARRETPAPAEGQHPLLSEAERAKFKPVACEDFGEYPDHVKSAISDADACIWTIAITPTKSKTMPWEEVRKTCVDYAINAVDTFAKLPRADKAKRFRFVYVSGSAAERDPAKKPWVMGDYCLMRGQIECQVLERVRADFEVAVAKPGMIQKKDAGAVARGAQTMATTLVGFPSVGVDEAAAALLNQAVAGFKADTLLNQDLVDIGRKALEEREAAAQ